MVNSKKVLKSKSAIPAHPLDTYLHQFLSQHLKACKAKPRLLLALSGGLDSCVLLQLLANTRTTLSFELCAMHVHHGLSPNADTWAEFCRKECLRLQVPFSIEYVDVNKDSGLGIEAEARQLRYEALFNFELSAPDFVVTAHHQDDQAETLLLQLFRGAGVKGLAGMASVDSQKKLLRPLLGIARHTLAEYAQLRQMSWCEDESNQNTAYERNFVRHQVMPELASRYPAIQSVLSRSAAHMAEAAHLLDDLAQLDASTLIKNNSLCLDGLSALEARRAKNVLRWWFGQNKLVMPNAEHLNNLLTQLLSPRADASVEVKLQHLTLRRFQHRAYLCKEESASEENLSSFDLVWNGEPELLLPTGGKLLFKEVIGSGIATKLGITKLRITNRGGGERFKPNELRPTRTLKYLFQEAHIPPWQRAVTPLVYWQDALIYVPNVGIAHEFQTNPSEAGLEITWQPA